MNLSQNYTISYQKLKSYQPNGALQISYFYIKKETLSISTTIDQFVYWQTYKLFSSYLILKRITQVIECTTNRTSRLPLWVQPTRPYTGTETSCRKIRSFISHFIQVLSITAKNLTAQAASKLFIKITKKKIKQILNT